MTRPQILLVDDCAEVGIIFERMLCGEPYDIRFYTDPNTAIEEARQAPPDLIILDVNMPNMDGFEACRRIKEIPQLDGLPVVLFTALDRVMDIARGFEAGANYFLSKETDKQELVERIREIMEGVGETTTSSIRVRDSLAGLAEHVSADIVAALEKAFNQLVDRNMITILGEDGARLVFRRALTRVRRRHPLVSQILKHELWLNAKVLPGLDSPETRRQVAEAITALISEVLRLLQKLTGAAYVSRLEKQLTRQLADAE